MAFHPRCWTQPVKNGSRDYNYQEWNRTSRQIAAQQIGIDTRKQPRPEEPIELEPQIRVLCPVGGVVLFSAAHMHSTVPNTSGYTRFSIDFRTIQIDAAAQAARGAQRRFQLHGNLHGRSSAGNGSCASSARSYRHVR